MTLAVRKTADLEVRPPIREQARQYLVGKRIEAVAVTRRQAWTAWQVARQLPGTGFRLVCYTPRGLARVTAAWARYLNDYDTADLRAHHAKVRESKEYKAVSDVRSANLTARIMVNGTAAAFVLGVVFAWTWPPGFGALLGLLVFVWTIKLIPGRHLAEVGVAAILAFVAFFAGPWLAGKVPVPPAWAFWLVGTGAIGGLGWAGRPRAAPLVKLDMGGRVPPLTLPMVTAALCTLGNSKMREPDDIRPLFDVGRHHYGYDVDVELPAGVPASWVIEKREELGAALRRELGCVWPSVGPRHPGHLSLFVSHEPMATATQRPWPLAAGRPVNLFEPLPLFTNQRGEWVKQTLAYTSWVIGAVPRMGKTYALRSLGLVAALDPRAKLYVFDLKGTGDLSSLAKVAHAYGVGDDPEDIEQHLRHMRAVREEMRRRTRFVRELTLEQNPDRGKVTDALAMRDPHRFGPIVVLVDECQVWFEEQDDKGTRDEFIAIMRDLVKRGPAIGIIPLLATQKPDSKSIPTSIADNASARLCFKVNGQVSNDQILGTSMYQAGTRATQFGFADKGIAYFKGDAADPLVVRTVYGLDAAAADKLAGKAWAIRAAAGLLTGEADDVEDVVVVDIVQDVVQVLRQRGLQAAHHAELVSWLQELRPDYEGLGVDELSTRLRNRGVVVSQVKRNSLNRKGVDLRKQPQALESAADTWRPVETIAAGHTACDPG